MPVQHGAFKLKFPHSPFDLENLSRLFVIGVHLGSFSGMAREQGESKNDASQSVEYFIRYQRNLEGRVSPKRHYSCRRRLSSQQVILSRHQTFNVLILHDTIDSYRTESRRCMHTAG